MVRPILEFGCVLFDSCSRELSDLLEGLQYESARICTGAMKFTSNDRLLAEIGWEALHTRRKFNKLVLLYKILNKFTLPTFMPYSKLCYNSSKPTASESASTQIN